MTQLALLRSPPFPNGDARVSEPDGDERALPYGMEATALFAHIRDARIGGTFWVPAASSPYPAGVVLRARRARELPAMRDSISPAERKTALWLHAGGRRRSGLRRSLRRLVAADGGAWRDEVDPWSVLTGVTTLVAHGDDEWVALARIARAPVRVLSPGRFGAPGEGGEVLDARALRALLSANYRDPFRDEATTILHAIDILAEWRRILDANRPIVAASGMAWWKRAEIRRFLWSPQHSLAITSRPRRALSTAARRGGALAIWPSQVSPALLAETRRRKVPLVRVEDGFVRSVGLGSNLVPPSSIVVDYCGIHFDPLAPSDLEQILAETAFTAGMLQRAEALRTTIVAAGISKYAAGDAAPAPPRPAGRKLVLVPGQVEDDMSVLAGGGGLRSNLEVLRRARRHEPDAEIWFRPHPDVDAGHRQGAVSDAQALSLANRIVREPSMSALLDTVDAVHVLTSLTGFEALLRGLEVTCHGTPFYAGWGLTRDLGTVPDRRGRRLVLDELVAGVLILYPRYLDPVTGLPCTPEVLVGRMARQQAYNRQSWIEPVRRWQGRLMAALR